MEIDRCRCQETQFVCRLHCHQAVAYIQLSVDVLQVLSHGAWGNAQSSGQTFRGQPLAQEGQDRHFSRRQIVGGAVEVRRAIRLGNPKVEGNPRQNWLQQPGQSKLLVGEVTVRSVDKEGVVVAAAYVQRYGQVMNNSPRTGQFLPSAFLAAAGQSVRNPPVGLGSRLAGKRIPTQQRLLSEVIAARWFVGCPGPVRTRPAATNKKPRIPVESTVIRGSSRASCQNRTGDLLITSETLYQLS